MGYCSYTIDYPVLLYTILISTVLPQVKSYYISVLTGIFVITQNTRKYRHLNYLVTHLLKDTLKTLDRQIDLKIRTN
ncbi:MAG: hypothetical protein ACXVHU_09405 [Methanobacterium sp.]